MTVQAVEMTVHVVEMTVQAAETTMQGGGTTLLVDGESELGAGPSSRRDGSTDPHGEGSRWLPRRTVRAAELIAAVARITRRPPQFS
jgi:hypothetical protein